MYTTEEIMKFALEMVDIEKIPADSGIYHKGKNIKKVLMGIDMGAAELKIAKDMGYDAVIAHHPQAALRTYYNILDEHVTQMVAAGVPEVEAKEAVKELKLKNELMGHSLNYDHARSIAKLLDMPFMNIHYPLDQLGRIRMQQKIAEETDENSSVADVIAALNSLDEVASAETDVELRLGKLENKAGKVVVSHGAGTNGGYDLAKTYFKNGISTLVYIHVKYPDLKKMQTEQNGNLIVTGHLTGDLLGINPFIEKLEKSGMIVDRVSGL